MRNFEEAPEHAIQSVVRAANVMDILAEADGPLSLSQIATAAGMGLPTAYRFLKTLEFLQWVERDPEVKRYRIAPPIVRLAHRFMSTSDLWQNAHPYLIQACRKYGETFNLSILDKADILYLDRVQTRRILTINLEIGAKLPAYCTSMGRVLLAYLPPPEALKIVKNSDRKSFTAKTVTAVNTLTRILEEVRQKGYAVNNGEMARELISVAAPVRNRHHRVVAAVNMAVNAANYDESEVAGRLIPAVMNVALQISQAMGYYTHQ
jgi:IclR family transcriptional regulator, pca regulon regulatory protein